MDPRLSVTDLPRDAETPYAGVAPLVTIAWRAIREECRRRAEQERTAQEEHERTSAGLARIAERVFQLRRTVQSLGQAGSDGGADPRGYLQRLAQDLLDGLAKLDIACVAPEGEAFTPELMELLENVAQRPSPGLDDVRIAEILSPAILQRGRILQMGKAVLAVPEPVSQGGTAPPREDSGAADV